MIYTNKKMKQIFKHHCITIIAASALCALSLKFTIAAASDIIILVQGSRTATIGTDTIDYGSTQLAFQAQTLPEVTLGTDGIIIDDLVSGSASWSVSIAANKFIGVSKNQEIAYNNIAIKGDEDGVIDVIAGSSNADGITTFTNFTNLSGSGETSNDLTIISADSRDRIGKYQIFPKLKLTIPANKTSDTYSNTLTFTFLTS